MATAPGEAIDASRSSHSFMVRAERWSQSALPSALALASAGRVILGLHYPDASISSCETLPPKAVARPRGSVQGRALNTAWYIVRAHNR